ncbi:MAG: lipoate--protein ligase family protein [Spirochaetia bacterium]|jgi:lipoate-protein ligase A|uniref:Lipoate-protein ligase A n=1 Tax=bioreactor metagenome TaxID=1076179 RepID=A0A644VUT2_9ZZZZ|nr:lipoate--protein ligase family protein [Spirochaetia bacterium]MCE1209258.1 lipoate--protein ligase family protein [Spirochaetia bacterium]
MKIESFVLEGSSPLEHLAVESALVESALIETWNRDAGLLLLYTNEACLVIGRNQNPWKEVNPRSRLPVYRRDSGGGAVYHDRGNLNWSLVVPRETHDRDGELALIAGALRKIGYPVEPGERGGLYCDASSANPGCKVSGTARRFGKQRVLHHGTLLVSSDLRALRSSLGGIETQDDRSLSSVPARAANISSIGLAVGLEALALSLSLALCESPPARFSPEGETRDRIRREAARLGALDWIYGATPGFSFRLPGKGGPFLFSVEQGFLSFPEGSYENHFARFRGIPFSFSTYFDMKKLAEQVLGSRRASPHRESPLEPTVGFQISKEV